MKLSNSMLKAALMLALGMSASAYGAQKLNLRTVNSDQIKEVLNFPANEGITLLKANKISSDLTIERYVQTYHGIPVWGHHIIVKRDGSGSPVSL